MRNKTILGKVAQELRVLQRDLERVRVANSDPFYLDPDNLWYTKFWEFFYDELDSRGLDISRLRINQSDKGSAELALFNGPRFNLYCRGSYKHRDAREKLVECFFIPGGKGSGRPDAIGPVSKPRQVAAEFVEALLDSIE